MVLVSVLGPLEVRGDGGPVHVGPSRHREVLAALVVDAARVVSTEALLDRVWGDGASGATSANLHAVISRLRGLLRNGSSGLGIATVTPGYRLDTPADAIDAKVFEDRLARARSSHTAGDLEGARTLVGEALGLWRGTAYADVRRPFAEAEAARLDGQRLAAHELAAELDLALGRHDAVLGHLSPLVAEHPLHESLRGRLMVALYRSGRQAEALALYDDVREVLLDELGLDPGPELQELRQRILQQDGKLLASSPLPAPPGPASSPVPGGNVLEDGGAVRQGALAEPGFVVPPNALLGREREVEYVHALVEESCQRLLTLTGVGGVGKTRLAHAVSVRALPAFRDGVAFVALASLTDPSMVVPELGRATGLAAVEGLDPVAAVSEHLCRKRVLVVLDNAEHLLDAGPQVAALVASCPGITVLVTSRAPLRVRGESQYQVQPLPLPAADEENPRTIAATAAVSLFADRARSAMPEFELGTDNAADVGAICRRLAGIPLALELAAAKVRLLPPREILARLDDVMASAGARDLPPRQRTMRAALDWSYDLLDPQAQRLFRRLSVFSGGFTFDAARVVAASDAETGILEPLETLVEQSLVIPEPEPESGDAPRFRMLEPVLQYARGRLTTHEERAARMAHLSYYLDLAETTEPAYRGGGAVEALALTQREHANMVAAVESGLALGRADLSGRLGWALWLFWWLRGNLREGRRLMEAVLTHDIPDDVRVRATAALGAMAFAQGDLEAAACWANGAELAAAISDVQGRAHSVAGEGLVALAAGDLDVAEARLRTAIPLCESVGDTGGWLWTLAHVWLATISLLRDAPEEALPLAEVALTAGRGRNDRLAIYVALFTASQIALRLGDHQQSRGQLEEGILLSQDTGDMANLAYFLDSLAVVESIEGRTRRVAVLLGAAQLLRETVGANVYGYYKPDESLRLRAAEDAHAALGAGEYADAIAEGRRLTVSEVVGYAVGADDESCRRRTPQS